MGSEVLSKKTHKDVYGSDRCLEWVVRVSHLYSTDQLWVVWLPRDDLRTMSETGDSGHVIVSKWL